MRVPTMPEVERFIAARLTATPREVFAMTWGGEWHLATTFRRPGVILLGVYDSRVTAKELRDDLIDEIAQREAA